MSWYRIPGGEGASGASSGPSDLALSTCLFRVENVSASAFVDALLKAYSGAEVIQQTRSASYDDLVNARQYPPSEASVIVVLGLRPDARGLLCVDPYKTLWNQAPVVSRVSAAIGRIVGVRVEDSASSLEVRWFEGGAPAPRGQPSSTYVSSLHALGYVGLHSRLAPSDLEPLELVVIRDYAAEELGLD